MGNFHVAHDFHENSVFTRCQICRVANFFCVFLSKIVLNLLFFLYIILLVIEMDFKFVAHSELDTIELAQNIESEKFPNMVICLDGELGSGKTIFTKAFADSMEVKDAITSPTFTIIKEYEGDIPLYHMDVYRLDGNIDGIGLEEYFNKNGVVIIEWASTIKNILPDERLDIKIKVSGENKRVFHLYPHGKKYEELCEAVL